MQHLEWKILAPVNLARDVSAFVDHAAAVADEVDGRITFLHADQENTSIAHEWPARIASNFETVVVPGHPAEVIPDYARSMEPDLLVMDPGSFLSWKSFWTPSLTSRILASWNGSVLLTGRKNARPSPIRRILGYLMLDQSDKFLLQELEALKIRSGAELILLNSVPEISEGMLLDMFPRGDRPLSRPRALEAMSEVCSGLDVPNKGIVKFGSPYDAIRTVARQYSVDLVAAARPRRRQPPGFCLDARSLLLKLPCPLLSTGSRSRGVSNNLCADSQAVYAGSRI